MNPPYQAPKFTESRGKFGKSIWEDFVKLALKLVKDGGYCCNIHPAKWRKPTNKLGKIIREFQIHYLSIHDIEDGMKNFKCQTRYDWYILQKNERYKNTIVRDERGIFHTFDMKNSFIPNAEIDKVINLLAGNNDKMDIIYDCSYHTQNRLKNGTMSKIKTDTHIYPCVYSIDSNDNVKLMFANYKNESHFGFPKLIFPSGAFQSVGMLLDLRGEYGLTQFARAIVDTPENLNRIYEVLKSPQFLKFHKNFVISVEELDKDILGLFRKDFWKDFL